MSVRPIDIQYMTSRAEDVQKIQQMQQNLAQQQQAQMYIQSQQKEEIRRKQINPSTRPEDVKIREEAKDSRKRHYNPSKGKNRENIPQKFSLEKRSSVVDIQI